ncbi:hypothetical protein [Pseudomonas sp. 22 E 5]|nr:hypothetical protein [Pseudomonas sp. 22 E 5]
MVQRALQQHAHLIAIAGVGQRQHLAQYTLPVEPIDLRFRVGVAVAHQADDRVLIGLRLSAEQLADAAVLLTEERHFKVAHGAQFIGEQFVHGQAHDHPGDRLRVEHLVLHQ